MKVYLLKELYDDGDIYESHSCTDICKIVDTEEKAKAWVFERATEFCKERIRKLKNTLEKGRLRIDENDNLYYEPFSSDNLFDQKYVEGIKSDILFFEKQLNSFKEGEQSYIINETDERYSEYYVYRYDVYEVE